MGLRAERAKLQEEDALAASDLMSVARARAIAIVAEAREEAESLLEAARATGRGIVAEAEAQAAAVRVSIEAEPDAVPANRGEPIDLNEASAEDLQVAGLSITQARRVVARRERSGRYESIEQLAELPGMPTSVLERIRPRIRV